MIFRDVGRFVITAATAIPRVLGRRIMYNRAFYI